MNKEIEDIARSVPSLKRRLRRLERLGYAQACQDALGAVLLAAHNRHGDMLDADALDDVELVARTMVSFVEALRSHKERTAVYRREAIRAANLGGGR